MSDLLKGFSRALALLALFFLFAAVLNFIHQGWVGAIPLFIFFLLAWQALFFRRMQQRA